MEIVNKILISRPIHPIALIINKEKINYNIFHEESNNKYGYTYPFFYYQFHFKNNQDYDFYSDTPYKSDFYEFEQTEYYYNYIRTGEAIDFNMYEHIDNYESCLMNIKFNRMYSPIYDYINFFNDTMNYFIFPDQIFY